MAVNPFSLFIPKTSGQKPHFPSLPYTILSRNTSFENSSPSPDSSENPFAAGFAAKD